MSISKKIINVSRDYTGKNLILGDEIGLFDTIHRQNQEVWDLYENLRSLDWAESDFDYTTCYTDFKTCDRSTYEMMLLSLMWQWETDSVAANSILNVMGPFLSSTDLFAAYARITDNEVVHSRVYSEIIRNSFDSPEEVIDDITQRLEPLRRLNTVGEVFSEVYETSHLYALGKIPNNQDTYNKAFLFIATLLIMERTQFPSSFGVTFTICNQGVFVPAGKAIQRIAQDELEIHVEVGKAVLKHELQTERGQIAYKAMKSRIQAVFDEIVQSELTWNEYLFSEGRELGGLNLNLLNKWALYNAHDAATILDLDKTNVNVSHDPLPSVSKWMNISKNQPANQEEQNGQYRVNILRRDDESTIIDPDF